MQLAFSMYKTQCPNRDGNSKVILDWLTTTYGPPKEDYFFCQQTIRSGSHFDLAPQNRKSHPLPTLGGLVGFNFAQEKDIIFLNPRNNKTGWYFYVSKTSFQKKFDFFFHQNVSDYLKFNFINTLGKFDDYTSQPVAPLLSDPSAFVLAKQGNNF